MTLQIYNKQQYQKIEVQEQRTKPNNKKQKEEQRTRTKTSNTINDSEQRTRRHSKQHQELRTKNKIKN